MHGIFVDCKKHEIILEGHHAPTFGIRIGGEAAGEHAQRFARLENPAQKAIGRRGIP